MFVDEESSCSDYQGCNKGAKSPRHRNVTNTFFKTVHVLLKDLRFTHGDAKLASYPRCHLTSLHPYFFVFSGCRKIWGGTNKI